MKSVLVFLKDFLYNLQKNNYFAERVIDEMHSNYCLNKFFCIKAKNYAAFNVQLKQEQTQSDL